MTDHPATIVIVGAGAAGGAAAAEAELARTLARVGHQLGHVLRRQPRIPHLVRDVH